MDGCDCGVALAGWGTSFPRRVRPSRCRTPLRVHPLSSLLPFFFPSGLSNVTKGGELLGVYQNLQDADNMGSPDATRYHKTPFTCDRESFALFRGLGAMTKPLDVMIPRTPG